MRRVKNIVTEIVGRATVAACLITVTSNVAGAWEGYPPERSTGFKQVPMFDPNVQAVAYNQRPSTRSMSPNAGIDASPQPKGSLFGALKLPSMPFSRPTADKNGTQPAYRSAPQYTQNQPRMGRVPQAPGARTTASSPVAASSGRMPMGQPLAAQPNANVRMAGHAQQPGAQPPGALQAGLRAPLAAPRIPQGGPTSLAQAKRMPPRSTSSIPMPVVVENPAAQSAKPVAASTPAPPKAAPLAAAPVKTMPTSPQPTSEPAASAPATAAMPQALPSSPADRLVAKAHELTTGAESEDDYTKIIETCRRARASQPGPETAAYANDLAAWAFNRRGQVKAEEGRDKEAMLDFQDAIRMQPDMWRAIHNRGVLLAQSGQFAKAFDDFNRTIELNPKFAKAYCNRAALFTVADDLPAAAQDYSRAVELDPNLAVAHRGRARVCHLLGELDQAVNHYDAAVQLAPNDAYAVSSRADLLTDIGRYEDAITAYEDAIRLEPDSSQSYSSSAWLLATCPDGTLRDPDLAIDRATRAMELCGEPDAVGFDTLAAAQASAGDFQSAVASMRKAIELASEEDRLVYLERLELYEQGRAFEITPVSRVAQASYSQNR